MRLVQDFRKFAGTVSLKEFISNCHLSNNTAIWGAIKKGFRCESPFLWICVFSQQEKTFVISFGAAGDSEITKVLMNIFAVSQPQGCCLMNAIPWMLHYFKQAR